MGRPRMHQNKEKVVKTRIFISRIICVICACKINNENSYILGKLETLYNFIRHWSGRLKMNNNCFIHN